MLPMSSQELVPDDMDAPFDAQQWLGEGGLSWERLDDSWTTSQALKTNGTDETANDAPAQRLQSHRSEGLTRSVA